MNLNSKFIEINEEKINLLKFLPKDGARHNSFQFSFYDIKEKLIVSKKIIISQKTNVSNYYCNSDRLFFRIIKND